MSMSVCCVVQMMLLLSIPGPDLRGGQGARAPGLPPKGGELLKLLPQNVRF